MSQTRDRLVPPSQRQKEEIWSSAPCQFSSPHTEGGGAEEGGSPPQVVTEDLPKASLIRLPSCQGSTAEEEEKKKTKKLSFYGAKCKVLKQDCDLIEEEICKGAEDDIDGRSQYIEDVVAEVKMQNGEQVKLLNQQNQDVEYSKIDGQDGSGMMMKEADETTEIFCAKKEETTVNTIKKENVFDADVGNGSECDKKDFDHNEENDFYPEVSQSLVVKNVKSFHGSDHQLDQNKETFVPWSDELEETMIENKNIALMVVSKRVCLKKTAKTSRKRAKMRIKMRMQQCLISLTERLIFQSIACIAGLGKIILLHKQTEKE